jgi:hypothetical protein
MKHYKYFVIIVLIAFTISTYSMRKEDENPWQDNNEETTPSSEQKKKGWKQRAKTAVKKTLSRKNKKPISTRAPIQALPEDLHLHILKLAMEPNEKNFKTALAKIRKIASVNKELYDFTNKNSLFIITNLSAYFHNTPELIIASYLATPAAKEHLYNNLDEISKSENIPLVTEYLQNPDINVNVQDKNGNNLLMSLVESLNIKKLKILLQNRKLNLNIQNNEGNTALHLALYAFAHSDSDVTTKILQRIIQSLIDHGALVTIPNNAGVTVRDIIGNLAARHPLKHWLHGILNQAYMKDKNI